MINQKDRTPNKSNSIYVPKQKQNIVKSDGKVHNNSKDSFAIAAKGQK